MKKILIALSAIGLIIFGASVLATVPSGDTGNMKFSEHGTYARLDEYSGGQTKINVPETYNGLPVTTIGADAFNDASIERIYLPITVTTVETDAFINCGDQVHVVLELINELADVPKDVANWGLGDFTARIRNFTATGRSDLFIVKGEIEPCVDVYIQDGTIEELLTFGEFEIKEYTKIVYSRDITPYNSAVDVSKYQDETVMMWTVEDTIYFWIDGCNVVMPASMARYYKSIDCLKTLETIEGIELLDTSVTTNMSDMFYFCNSLKTLDLSTFDTSKVTTMSGMFALCYDLEDLNISNWDTSKVTNMTFMFSNCKILEELDVSHFNTSSVTSMQNMFTDVHLVEELDVTNFDTSLVTDMGGMFSRCSSLESIDVTNFNTSNVTAMYDMFLGCTLLKEIDLSNFDLGRIQDTSAMFAYCVNLTSVEFLTEHTGRLAKTDRMFYGCTNIEDIDFSNISLAALNEYFDMFYECPVLTDIYVATTDSQNFIMNNDVGLNVPQTTVTVVTP